MFLFFVLAFPGLFLQFCPRTWGVVLWGALVASHGSFGLPVVFLKFQPGIVRFQKNSLKTEPIMISSSGLLVVAAEDNEVS